MSEQVNILSRTDAEHLLFSAMVLHCKDDLDMLKIFNIPEREQTVTVQVLVNGVEVPFLASVADNWGRIMKQFDQAVREEAESRLKGSNLKNLERIMREFDWQIGEELNKLFPNTKGEWS